MGKHITLGLVLGAISMSLGTVAGIIAFNNSESAKAVTSTQVNTEIHTNPNINRHYVWLTTNTIVDYNPDTETGGFATNDTYCRQGTGSSYSDSYYNEYSGSSPYISAGTKTKQSGSYKYAFYAPFYLRYTVPARTIANYWQFLNLQMYGDGTAIKSAEIFYFEDAPKDSIYYYDHPTRFWFVKGDSTTTETGMPNSLGRTVSTSSSTKSGSAYFHVNYKNSSDEDVNLIYHFGLFMYQENPGSTSQGFTVRVSANSGYANSPLIEANNLIFDNINEAVAEYNSKDNSVLSLNGDVTLMNDITLSSAGGTVDLNGNTLKANDYSIRFTKETTVQNGTVTGSGTNLFIVDAANVFVTFKDKVDVTHNGAATFSMGVAAVGSTIKYGESGIASNTNSASDANVVALNAGTFILGGTLQSYSASQNTVRFGTSSDAEKKFQLYKDSGVNGYVYTHSSTDSIISAKYKNLTYTGSGNINIKTSGTYAINSVVVKDVDNTNYQKFLLTKNYCTTQLSSTDLIVVATEYNVTFTLTGVTRLDTHTTATYYSSYSFQFVVDEHYELPSSITVTIAGTTAKKNTAYSYSVSGIYATVTLYQSRVNGWVNIRIDATPVYTVTFLNPDGTIAADSISKVKNGSIKLPTATYNLPQYKTFSCWTVNSDGTGNYYSSQANYTVTKDITLYAHYYADDYDACNEFVGIKLHFDVDVIDINNTNDTGECKGENGFYQIAKTAYNELTSSQKQKFCTYSAYKNGRERLSAWARANGDMLDLTSYEIVSVNSQALNVIIQNNNAIIVIAMVIGTVSLSGAALFLFKKKKYNR